MRVGIDYRPALLNATGIGRYTRELVRAIVKSKNETELLLYGHSWKKATFPLETLGIENGNVQLFRKRIPSRLIHGLQAISGTGIEAFLGQVDLFHYSDFVYPKLRKTPFVATIHDAAFLEEGFFPAETRETLKTRALWAIENSRLVIVPSKFAAGELVLRLGAKPGRVAVIPLGADHVSPVAPEKKSSSETPYILTVGTIEPRKNHLRIFEAFEILVKKGFPHRWIIAGKKGWLYEPFFRKLENSPVRSRVEWREETSETELAKLYANAELTAYVSLYEGFGLPTLEAMRCGSPVLTSAVSSMPEICGNAAYYVDPQSPESIAEGMEKILREESLRAKLQELGFSQAANYTWAETARRTLSVYKTALQGTEGSLRKLF